jgi:hypothetical protein
MWDLLGGSEAACWPAEADSTGVPEVPTSTWVALARTACREGSPTEQKKHKRRGALSTHSPVLAAWLTAQASSDDTNRPGPGHTTAISWLRANSTKSRRSSWGTRSAFVGAELIGLE